MSSPSVDNTMFELFCRHLPLSPAQNQRLALATVGVLLAGSSRMSEISRWLNKPIGRAGREQFLRRLWDAPFMEQERAYQPLLRSLLAGYQAPIWHVVIDRTTLDGYQMELLVIGLAYHDHAIPLVWRVIDFGCTGSAEQIELWRTVVPLIPPGKPVIAHGDTEFGSVGVMRFLRQQGWHFILAQTGNTCFRLPLSDQWTLLNQLTITPRHPVYLEQVIWTQQFGYGPLNLFAFYDPHQPSPEAHRCEYRYCATSLPIAHTLRAIGRRRWGIECCFKDFKSNGWNLELSRIDDFDRRDSLLLVLSLAYLWSTAVGRWLCKTGKRTLVDAHAQRQLSLFRIGWDWLLLQFRQDAPWPLISTLYA